MKNLLTASVLALMACSAAAAGTAAKVLSTTEFDTGVVKVELAKTMDSDGNVCQQYVSKISVNSGANDDVNVTVSKFCGKPVQKAANAPFPAEVYPAKLSEMNVVRTADGLAIQLPVIDQ